MSEPRDESAEVATLASPASEGASGGPPARASVPGVGRGRLAIVLAGALLVVALVATGPLWAPLLPWGAASAPNDVAPDDRIGRIEAAQRQSEQQSQQAAAAANAALQGVDQRIGALEARPTASAGDIADLRQQVAALAGTAADLATRIEAIDKAVRSQTASDPTDIALVLALLQIRDAVEAGRPFAAAYETVVALAPARPEIAAAAAPLAEPATTGVADRPVLANRLRELARAVAVADTAANASANASASAPANANTAAPDWADRAWQRLRGLATIRRIDESAAEPPGGTAATAVNAALQALAGGDLEGAVGALDQLTGAPAEAAGPWLRMARERLAVEAALQRMEALLAARLGNAANVPASSGPPR